MIISQFCSNPISNAYRTPALDSLERSVGAMSFLSFVTESSSYITGIRRYQGCQLVGKHRARIPVCRFLIPVVITFANFSKPFRIYEKQNAVTYSNPLNT